MKNGNGKKSNTNQNRLDVATTSQNGLEIATPPEAAELLRISPRTLHTLTKAGTVPSFMLGPRARRYSVAALRKFVESQANGE